jgi:hypothetical protein
VIQNADSNGLANLQVGGGSDLRAEITVSLPKKLYPPPSSKTLVDTYRELFPARDPSATEGNARH